jgi:hypothetical protein
MENRSTKTLFPSAVVTPNNFVKATPGFAILLLLNHTPGAPYDNR